MSEKEHTTLGHDLPIQMARVRDEVLPEYVALGRAGAIGAAFMRKDLDDAARAMAAGDILEMIRVYQSLKETEL